MALGLGLSLSFGSSIDTGTPVVDPDAAAIIAAMTASGAPPNAARQTIIDSTVLAMKGANPWAAVPWTKLDLLLAYAAHHTDAAVIDWITRASMTRVNAPVFTVDEGYNSGGGGYIKTVDLAGVPILQQNNACYFDYIRTHGGGSGLGSTFEYGITYTPGDQSIYQHNSIGNTGIQSVNGDYATFDSVPTVSTGLFLQNRVLNTEFKNYERGFPTLTYFSVSTGVPVGVEFPSMCFYYPGELYNRFSQHQHAFMGFGGGMTPNEIAALNYAMHDIYLTGIGKNPY